MKKRKYRLYLTAEERRYLFNALLVCRNKLPTQGGRGYDKAAKMSL